MSNDQQKELVAVLQQFGSRSTEYRRLHRRAYRKGLRRIDYIPSRQAWALIDRAIEQGDALSMSDAIDQAVIGWWADDESPE